MRIANRESVICLDKTDIRPHNVDDPEEIGLLCYIHADAEVRFLALHGLQKRFRSRIGMVGCPLCVGLPDDRRHVAGCGRAVKESATGTRRHRPGSSQVRSRLDRDL